jgi:hypothetical protein
MPLVRLLLPLLVLLLLGLLLLLVLLELLGCCCRAWPWCQRLGASNWLPLRRAALCVTVCVDSALRTSCYCTVLGWQLEVPVASASSTAKSREPSASLSTVRSFNSSLNVGSHANPSRNGIFRPTIAVQDVAAVQGLHTMCRFTAARFQARFSPSRLSDPRFATTVVQTRPVSTHY